MTEKRFIVIDDGLDFIIRDTITDDYLIDANGVIDVLNDYEKENEQLKQYINHIHALYEDTHGINMENEEWWEDE